MDFTYHAYEDLLNKLRDSGYAFSDYRDWNDKPRPVILRHDIDFDIGKAVLLAGIENRMRVKSTYFVLLTSDFYNPFSKEANEGLSKIIDYGCSIGLHFDETRYPDCKGDIGFMKKCIKEEADILGRALGIKINQVSMHRPSKGLLDADVSIPGMVNSYSSTFFKEFKYLSDSRRNWREPVDEILRNGVFDKLHILTHAFWYNKEEIDLRSSVKNYILEGNVARYKCFNENITDLNQIVAMDEIR